MDLQVAVLNDQNPPHETLVGHAGQKAERVLIREHCDW